jgi:hypothetical protein
MQEGINLPQDEITSLEEVGLYLTTKKSAPHSLFNGENSNLVNPPSNARTQPFVCNNKKV